MGLTVTTSHYCFVRCDGPRCTKRIEQSDEKALIRLVKLCGWEQRGNLWFCEDCAKRVDYVPS